uniref:Uncharacterized protein n=1 Tax=Rhizophora mucronata TaxID=61149 RepID=A0A2P2PJP8_RHIMU
MWSLALLFGFQIIIFYFFSYTGAKVPFVGLQFEPFSAIDSTFILSVKTFHCTLVVLNYKVSNYTLMAISGHLNSVLKSILVNVYKFS